MKKIILTVIVVLLATGSLTCILAGPIPTSNMGKEYVISVPDLRLWSFGLFQSSAERKTESLYPGEFEYSRTMVYVGYDAWQRITTYVTAGPGKTKIGKTSPTDDSQPHFGVGLHFNLIDKDILDPTLIEDRIRVVAGMEYTKATAEWNNNDIRFDEFSASLLASLVNDLGGEKYFWPNSIALFGGLLYSDIMSDSKYVSPSETVGFTGGLEIFYTESISLFVAAENLENSGYTAGVNVRF